MPNIYLHLRVIVNVTPQRIVSGVEITVIL
jgi:hypothetical protein